MNTQFCYWTNSNFKYINCFWFGIFPGVRNLNFEIIKAIKITTLLLFFITFLWISFKRNKKCII